MRNRTSYEEMAEDGDVSSAFDFSEKSIRHGNIEIALMLLAYYYFSLL